MEPNHYNKNAEVKIEDVLVCSNCSEETVAIELPISTVNLIVELFLRDAIAKDEAEQLRLKNEFERNR